MKTAVFAALTLVLSVGLAAAKSDDASPAVLNDKALVTTADADTVQRAKPKPRGFTPVYLPKATVADVDLNKDGHISFDELLRHDVTHDF